RADRAGRPLRAPRRARRPAFPPHRARRAAPRREPGGGGMTRLTDEDVLFMESIGIDGAEAAESDGAAPARSEWAPERMLQVAADGQLTARPVAGSEDLMAVVADGRPATIQEHAAI